MSWKLLAGRIVAAGPDQVRHIQLRNMTEQQAEKAATFVLGVAAAGAAYYILKTPPLRRLAWQLARTAVLATAPAWLMNEARRAWQDSDSRPPAL